MLSYILSRLVALALSLVVASLVIFVMIELVPGDPASFMLGLNAAPDTVAALRAELGLGGSPVERYLRWVGGMLQGDFGTSYTYRAPVAELVTARLAVSLPLALMALLLSTLIAIPVGLYAASRRGKPAGGVSFAGTGQSDQLTPVRSLACVGAFSQRPLILALATPVRASWNR